MTLPLSRTSMTRQPCESAAKFTLLTEAAGEISRFYTEANVEIAPFATNLVRSTARRSRAVGAGTHPGLFAQRNPVRPFCQDAGVQCSRLIDVLDAVDLYGVSSFCAGSLGGFVEAEDDWHPSPASAHHIQLNPGTWRHIDLMVDGSGPPRCERRRHFVHPRAGGGFPGGSLSRPRRGHWIIRDVRALAGSFFACVEADA